MSSRFALPFHSLYSSFPRGRTRLMSRCFSVSHDMDVMTHGIPERSSCFRIYTHAHRFWQESETVISSTPQQDHLPRECRPKVLSSQYIACFSSPKQILQCCGILLLHRRQECAPVFQPNEGVDGGHLKAVIFSIGQPISEVENLTSRACSSCA